MVDGSLFDVALFGYRNDVARARTLAFLSDVPPSPSGPLRLDRDTTLPQRLFSALESERAQQLQAQLEELGAQVALIQVGLPPASELPGVARLERVSRTGVRAFATVLIMLVGAAAYLGHAARQPEAPPAPQTHAANQMEPLTGTTEGLDQPVATLNADAVQLANSGEFRQAAARLRVALSLAPDDPVLRRNLQAVLFNWGLADLAADKPDDAGDHLQQAAELGDRLEVLKALGGTYLRLADYDHAVPTLERVLQIAPSDTNTMLALADVYLKQDKRPQALDLLQRAKDAGASGTELDKRLGQLSREVDAEWDFVQLQSPHFQVSLADDQDTSTVRQVLYTLEDAYYAVGAKLYFYPDGRTPVVLYTQQDFHAVTQTPDWAGAAFDGRIKVPVRGLTPDDRNLARILQHEYAHSLVARLSGARCPVWLNEGIAVWAEEAEDGERQTWAENTIADQELFGLDELNGSFANFPVQRAEVAYAESYLAVRDLIDGYGARKISALLEALRRTGNMNDAFAAVYPGDLPGFQRQLLRQLGG